MVTTQRWMSRSHKTRSSIVSLSFGFDYAADVEGQIAEAMPERRLCDEACA